MSDIEVGDIPPTESFEPMDEFVALSESVRRLDQSKLFEDAFNYVKSKKNVNTINIGLILHCFYEEKSSIQDKFVLGWTALAMLNGRKEKLLKTMTEEDFQKLAQDVIEKMVEKMC